MLEQACDRVLGLLPVAARVLGQISDEHRADVGCAGPYKISDLTCLFGASRLIYRCYGPPAQALLGFETDAEIRRLTAEAVLMENHNATARSAPRAGGLAGSARSRANDMLLDLWFPKAHGARAPAPPGELLLEACDWAAVAVTSIGSKGAGRQACLSAMTERVVTTCLFGSWLSARVGPLKEAQPEILA